MAATARIQTVPEPGVVAPEAPLPVTLAEVVPVRARIAALSFGGPAGQIAVMHRILVEEKRWISENRFLHALNFCTLLPGPEAPQLATYVGWLMHGTRGGLVAGGLFVLPGVVAIMALSWIYALYGNVGYVAGLFFGLKGGGARHRAPGGDPHRQAGAQGPRHARTRGGLLRGHLLPRRALPADRALAGLV